MDDEKYQKLHDYALRLLSFRPRSVSELRGKLLQFTIKKGIPESIIPRLISGLKEKNLVNDEEFVKWWADQRKSFRPKGAKFIKLELLQKGIDREIIDKILTQSSNTEEFQQAKQLAEKKIFLYKNLSAKEKKIKIGNFLARRGFDWETVYRVIDLIVKKS